MLMKAMEKGMTLLISSICTAELSGDSYLQDVLQCRRQLLYANHPVKVMVIILATSFIFQCDSPGIHLSDW